MSNRLGLMFWTSLIGLIFYWAYLGFVTQPVLVHDAKGYADLGRMIAEQGWRSYFLSGPNREPIYPFLIAFTTGDNGQTNLGLLKFIQITLLFLTVIFAYFILLRSKIAPAIIISAIVYLGLSPALVNSTLSVYSEIVAYLFILGIVWFGSRSFLEIQKQDSKTWLFWGLGFAGAFVLAVLVKSIYEVIFYLCLLPFFVVLVRALKEKDPHVIKNTILFLLLIVVSFQVAICGYKYLNKKYNGLFVLTDRAAWAFYGTVARRQMPLDAKSFGAAVAYNLLEEDGCKAFYNAEQCEAWRITTADKFSSDKNYEVMARFPPQEQNRELLKASFAKIMENPAQYFLLMTLDWVHLFFWESTRIGFVVYPDQFDAVFDEPLLAKTLRFTVGVLSFGALIFVVIFLMRQHERNEFSALLLFAAYVVICHVTLYSLFFTLPRFSLPIAPLFIILIAACGHILTIKKAGKS